MIDIQAVVDLNTYPFVVLEGSIRGNLYTAPGTGWKVTSGYFGTPNSRYPFSLFIEAEASPLGNAATAARPVLPAGTVHQKISIVCALSGASQCISWVFLPRRRSGVLRLYRPFQRLAALLVKVFRRPAAPRRDGNGRPNAPALTWYQQEELQLLRQMAGFCDLQIFFESGSNVRTFPGADLSE